jgi:hypothetical protein
MAIKKNGRKNGSGGGMQHLQECKKKDNSSVWQKMALFVFVDWEI